MTSFLHLTPSQLMTSLTQCMDRVLSSKLEDHQFVELYNSASMPDKACLLSISLPHASAWLSVIPSPRSQSHPEPNEFQVALQWWLGIGVSEGSTCVYCPNHSLDHFGHHSLTCKHGGDVVTRHNRLRDVLVEYCHLAHVACQVEMGSGGGSEKSRTQSADVLIPNWSLGKPAALDLTVTSPLKLTFYPKRVWQLGLQLMQQNKENK